MSFPKILDCLDHFLRADNKALLYYDTAVLKQYISQIKKCFPKKTQHAVAIKTNPNPDVLKFIISEEMALEAASIEEVNLALELGIDSSKIIFDSPAKTPEEIEYFQQHCTNGLLNANCLAELNRIPKFPTFRLGLRINPSIDSGAPNEFNVSTPYSKFGVPIHQLEDIKQAIDKFRISCLHMHVGSDFQHFDATAKAIHELEKIAGDCPNINCLDIGGGLPAEKDDNYGILSTYIMSLKKYAPKIMTYDLVTEFGRYYHQHAGIFASRIEYVLKRGGKQIAIIHAGADLFLREVYINKPKHPFLIFDKHGMIKQSNPTLTDVGGPLCFAADYIAQDIKLPRMEEGDIIIMTEAGANNWGMWSRHCSREPIEMRVI